MIKNEIKHIKPNEIDNITAQAKASKFYLVNLDGREIQNEREYIDIMYKEFFFPSWDIPNSKPNYNAYMDWIRDLDWLIEKGSKGFVLIIDYYKSFLVNEPYNENHLEDGKVVYKFKEYLEIEGFKDIINYWEYEIIECIAGGGTPRSFNIYLVDR